MNLNEGGMLDLECKIHTSNLWSEKDPDMPLGFRVPSVQDMVVISRSQMIPMMANMASLQACVPTAPAWIADTM